MALTRTPIEREEHPVMMPAHDAYERIVTAVDIVGRVKVREDESLRVTGRVRVGSMRPAEVSAVVTPDGEDTAVLALESTAAEAISRVLEAF